MVKRVKFTPKELKKPDKFREAIAEAIVVISENYVKILFALGIIIVTTVGALAIRSSFEGNKLEANSKFSEAMKSYTDGNKKDALNKLLLVRKEYPREDISKIALYYAADINYEMGKYDQAISLFNDFLGSGVKDEMLRDAAYFTLGLANFNKGNWQNAIDTLSKLDTQGSPYEDQAKLHVALSLEKLGKLDEAEEIYKQLLTRYSGGNPEF